MKHHEGYVNVYKHTPTQTISYFHSERTIYDTREQAKAEGATHKDYITTIRINWEG